MESMCLYPIPMNMFCIDGGSNPFCKLFLDASPTLPTWTGTPSTSVCIGIENHFFMSSEQEREQEQEQGKYSISSKKLLNLGMIR